MRSERRSAMVVLVGGVVSDSGKVCEVEKMKGARGLFIFCELQIVPQIHSIFKLKRR